jgi:hypothetical protein
MNQESMQHFGIGLLMKFLMPLGLFVGISKWFSVMGINKGNF